MLDVERTHRSGRLIICHGPWTDNRIRAANGGLQAIAEEAQSNRHSETQRFKGSSSRMVRTIPDCVCL